MSIFTDQGSAEGVPGKDEFPRHLEDIQRSIKISLHLVHTVSGARFVRTSVPAHIQGDDAIISRKFAHLIHPLSGFAAKPMNEYIRSFWAFRGNINRRKSH